MRTAPAIVLIAAFAALSSIGDTSAAGNVVAVPPAEYRPTLVVPKAAAALRRAGRAGVPRSRCRHPARPSANRSRRRTRSAPSSVGWAGPHRSRAVRSRSAIRASCRPRRARSCSPTSRGRRCPTAAAPPASRSPRRAPRRCGCRCRCPRHIPISRCASSATRRARQASRARIRRTRSPRPRRARCVLVAGARRRHGDDRGARGRRRVLRRPRCSRSGRCRTS